jgi:peptidylprolyl isomerase
MRSRHAGIVTGVVLALGCAPRASLPPAPAPAPALPALPAAIPPVQGPLGTAFALRYIDVAVGTGPALRSRQCVYAHYTGWLTDGTKFDSSRDTLPNGAPRPPYAFAQGARRVIAGWDEGFKGMNVGGRRRLFVPYQLAYGESGRPPVIPPSAELIFDVELLAVADTLPRDAAAVVGAPGPRCPAWSDLPARQ